MSRKIIDIEFNLTYRETLELSSEETVFVYNINPMGTTLPDKLHRTLKERALFGGYICSEVTDSLVIICSDKSSSKNYVCLWLNKSEEPICICNDFIYGDTVLEDLHKLIQDWVNIYVINNKLKNHLNKLSGSFRNYTVMENDDEIQITIKK